MIFAPIPGAFETRYQAAPLDLAEDTFYYARQALADARITEIEAGRAPEILERTYDAHAGVLCVGVRWDLFTKEDLVALVKVSSPYCCRVLRRGGGGLMACWGWTVHGCTGVGSHLSAHV